jgi:hypothetical protein
MTKLAKYITDSEKYDILLSAINDGNFLPGSSLKDYYNIFIDSNFTEKEELKAALFFAIKRYEKFQDFSLLSSLLNISEDSLTNLLKSNYKKATFPISDNNEAELVSLYLIEVEDEIPVSFPNTEALRLNSIQNIKKTLNKNFFVFFDKCFSGRSFGLAVASCFYVSDEIRERFIFTGEVRADGGVYDVDGLELKFKVAHQNNKYLVSSRCITHISELKHINSNELNVPFVQLFGKSKSELDKNFKKLKGYIPESAVLLNIFGFSQEDLSVFTEDYLNNEINDYAIFLNEFYKKVKKLYDTNIGINLHITGSLSSFAFLMGLVLGAKKKFAIYHYQDGEIYKIYDFINQSARKLKGKKNNFSHIQYKTKVINANSTDLLVSIYLASHSPKNDASKFASQTLKCNIVEIELKNHQGNLPIDNQELWIEIVREIYSVLDNISDELGNNVERYHIILSTPVPIAIALGMAIGDYKKFSVYNFDKKVTGYKKVFDSDFADNVILNSF